jgi:2-keto-3-deoxy-L-rhamnonate aldolase RhmA
VGNRLFANLAAGITSVGVGITMPSVEIVDAYGRGDWDVFYANMHSSRIDWHDLADMVRAAGAWEMTACARIPMQPWVGGDNPVLPVDAHRAFSLGSSVVMASVRSAAEARSLVEIMLVEERRLHRELLSIPAIETLSAWNRLDDILAVEGLRAVFLGVSDLAQEIGAPNLEAPKLRDLIRSFVDRTHERGVRAAVNIGYPGDAHGAWERSVARTHLLRDFGVDIVFAVPAEDFISVQVRRFVDEVRADRAAGRASAEDK